MERKHKIFVCYSRKDSEVLDELQPILERLKDHRNIDYFIDKRNIDIGTKWDEEIQKSIEHSTIAIILLSGNLLNSKYATKREIPLLINSNKSIFPLLLRKCDYKSVSDLEGIDRFQFINESDKPFQSLDKEEKENLLEKLSERISSLCIENEDETNDHLIHSFVKQFKNKYVFDDKKQLLLGLKAMATNENQKFYSECFSAYLHWYENREDHAKETVEMFESIFRKDKSFALAYFGAANVYEHGRKMEGEALYYYDLAMYLQEELSAYVYLGKANVYRNKFARTHRHYDFISAERYYKKSISEDDNNPYPFEGLATLYRANKLYDESEFCCNEALRISPGYSTPWVSLGRLFEHKHEYERAKNCFKTAHAIDPKFPKPISYLISLYEKEGDETSAEEFRSKAKEL